VAKDQTRTWDFDVRNCGSGSLTWSVSDDKNWISVYPTSGSTTTERDTVTVRIDTQGLSPGTHTGYITLTSNGGDKTGTITVVVPKPKPQNQPPENPILTPDRSSPQLAGTTIKWTASATDPDGDTLYYQFRLKGPVTGNSWQIKRDWSTARTWTWYTTASDVGESDISVRIRDGHHAQASSYDLEKVYSDYTIQSGENQPPVNPTLTPNKAEPQNAGTSITWTASATDPDGGSLYYRFWIKGPATGNSWAIERDWSSINTWTWYTTSSDVGDNVITVWIRDGHHAQASSYDLEKTVYDYKITADKKRPTATIDSITPNPATQGDDTVRFKGHGYDSDGYIVEYYWKSSKDGKLSSSKEFKKSASNLAVGTHTIYFKVTDDDGQWSDWATMTLKIEEKKEDSKYVKFRGKVLVNRPIISFYSIDVRIDDILNDPTGKLRVGDVVTAWSHRDSQAQVADPSVGDRVEVCGKYYGQDVRGGVESEYIDLETKDHYLKIGAPSPF
jgi:hypothetical protein